MKKIIAISCLFLFFLGSARAVQIPVGQSAGSNVREYREARNQARIKERLINPVVIPPSISAAEIKELPKNKSGIYIKKIVVQCGRGVDADVKDKRIQDVLKKYKGNKLSLKSMNVLAKQISELYADKNVKAYIPKQSFTGNILFINLVEGEK